MDSGIKHLTVTDDLRSLWHDAGPSMQSVADHFNVSLTAISRIERASCPSCESASCYPLCLKEIRAQAFLVSVEYSKRVEPV